MSMTIILELKTNVRLVLKGTEIQYMVHLTTCPVCLTK